MWVDPLEQEDLLLKARQKKEKQVLHYENRVMNFMSKMD